MDCYQHPGTEATATCVACNQPICGECREDVAGHAMCHSCVAATQQRLAATPTPEPAVAAAAPGTTMTLPSSAPGQVAPWSTPDQAGAVGVPAPPEPALPCGASHYLKAIAFGTIAAIAGAFVWDKFVFYTNIAFGLIAVLIGVAVGFAVKTGAEGRKGAALPWIGALLAAFGMLLGNVLLVYDAIFSNPELAAAASRLHPVDRLVRLVPATVQHMDIMDWLFVAFGVYEGWSIPRKANME